MARQTIELRIKRQDSPTASSRWEEFSIPYQPNMNVISCLMEIRKNPVTKSGQKTTPVNWESSCLEEVCGACTMLINGKPRQSYTALVDHFEGVITLEPLTKFPVLRDLQVERKPMFDALKRVQAWVPIDGTYDLGPGPKQSAVEAELNYAFSRCMTCGCCMEACPQYHKDSKFIGPAALGQVRLHNSHPTGAYNKQERLHAIMGEGGITDCGNAQNCVKVCPKEIPLTTAIGELGRQTTIQWIRDLFAK